MRPGINTKKTGILGGTFDPPHNAHMGMALAAVEQCGFDRVILIPNGDPPHKNVRVASADRLMMTKLAAREFKERLGSDCIEVSDIEISRPGYSFLVNTIEQLKAELPEDELYFMAGGDAIMSMASWVGAARIFELANILAFKRAGSLGNDIASAVRYLERRGAKVELAEAELPQISSTDIRRLITEGADVSSLVPKTVAEYIKENNLYTA